MTDSIANEKFLELVKGKNVVLIGPGRTIENNQEEIDKYDTIIRCGQTLPIKSEHYKNYGKKTDIIYNALDNDLISGGNVDSLLEIWTKERIKLVCCAYPVSESNSSRPVNIDKVRKHFLVKEISSPLYFSYSKKINSRPNSGFCAFIDVFHAKPKKMHVIGIDFFRSLCYSGYKKTMGNWNHEDFIRDMQPGLSKGNHDPDAQYALFKRMCQKFEFITYDNQIQSFFEDEKSDKLENFL